MDSRQFAILVLAIFIPTLVLATQETNVAPAVSQASASSQDVSTMKTQAPVPSELATKPEMGSSPITTTKSAAPNESSPSATTKSAAPNESSASTTIKSAEPVKPSNTAPTAKVDTLAEAVPKTTEAPAVSTTAAPTVSSTNAAKSTEVVNDHAVRDVSSQKCSAAYMAAVKVNWVPEKAILAFLEGGAVVTVDHLCNHLDGIKQLNATCNNANVKLDSEDKKVATIVAGLYSMFSNVCDDKKSFIVHAGNSTPCVELIQSTTKTCSTNSLAKALFPTEVLFEEMVKENCTVVFKTKECIINELEKSDKCSEFQRVDLKKMINRVTKVLPCSLPISAETTPVPTEVPSTTTPTTTTPTTTTTATVITTKSHSYSSANGLQVNFFTVLPVLLVAFKFY